MLNLGFFPFFCKLARGHTLFGKASLHAATLSYNKFKNLSFYIEQQKFFLAR